MVLFHHDPMHSDDILDRLHDRALEQWSRSGGEPADLELAYERREIVLDDPTGRSVSLTGGSAVAWPAHPLLLLAQRLQAVRRHRPRLRGPLGSHGLRGLSRRALEAADLRRLGLTGLPRSLVPAGSRPLAAGDCGGAAPCVASPLSARRLRSAAGEVRASGPRPGLRPPNAEPAVPAGPAGAGTAGAGLAGGAPLSMAASPATPPPATSAPTTATFATVAPVVGRAAASRPPAGGRPAAARQRHRRCQWLRGRPDFKPRVGTTGRTSGHHLALRADLIEVIRARRAGLQVMAEPAAPKGAAAGGGQLVLDLLQSAPRASRRSIRPGPRAKHEALHVRHLAAEHLCHLRVGEVAQLGEQEGRALVLGKVLEIGHSSRSSARRSHLVVEPIGAASSTSRGLLRGGRAASTGSGCARSRRAMA